VANGGSWTRTRLCGRALIDGGASTARTPDATNCAQAGGPAKVRTEMKTYLPPRLYLFGLLGLIGLLGIPFHQPILFLFYPFFGLFALAPRKSADAQR
jgi:hypothetical protein